MPQGKKVRSLKIAITAKHQRILSKKPYPPGQHGQERKRKLSDYGLQLLEKQKCKFVYGLREKPLQRLFKIAAKNPENTGELFLVLLERRLDNVVYRGNLAYSRLHARQMISHGKFTLNQKKIDAPGILIKVGDEISPKISDKEKIKIQENIVPDWLLLNKKTKTITVKKLPVRLDAPAEIDEQLIVEFYNR